MIRHSSMCPYKRILSRLETYETLYILKRFVSKKISKLEKDRFHDQQLIVPPWLIQMLLAIKNDRKWTKELPESYSS